VSIEKDEMRELAAFPFFSNPKQPLHRSGWSTFAARVELFDTECRWSFHDACDGAALTWSTFDRGLFRHRSLGL